jgi:hypothetical protein
MAIKLFHSETPKNDQPNTLLKDALNDDSPSMRIPASHNKAFISRYTAGCLFSGMEGTSFSIALAKDLHPFFCKLPASIRSMSAAGMFWQPEGF